MYFSDNHIKNRCHLQAFCPSMAIRTTHESIIRIKPAESLYGATRWPKCFWKCLRKFRKSKKERFGACGSSANQKENALAFAGLPQIKKRTFWRLRKFRKSKRERFGVCGTPANQKKNVLALAEVPQAFPKALWPLQRSIQAILQGLGASFFRSSLRCKDFWKGRSAVEGICFVPDRSSGGHTLLRSISEVPI